VAFDVKSVWAGALTSSSARVVADTAPPTNGSLLVADNEAMTGAVTVGPVTASAEGILSFTVTGLDADTRYWYVVDAGGLNTSYKGTFRTHPGPVGEPLSYIFGAAGDAGLTGVGDDSYITTAVSNNPVFDTMTAQSRAEEWAWFSHLGDLHYRNISTNTPASFRTAYDENFNFNLGFNPAARQGTFLRQQGITYIWDDHDFGGNDSNRTAASNPAANQVYRECVPHYPLAGGSTGIYQSWQVGRVLYVATDSRSFRDPNSDPQKPSKTLLGTGQKVWFENLLTTARDSGAEALVWQSSSRWIGGDDTWSSFLHEQDEMVQMFGDTGWLDRMAFMTADEHALSICSGPYNPYGHFPMFMFASMDSSYGTNSTAIYDVGQRQGRQQYGTMRVTDLGHTIALTGTGYVNGAVWKTYTKHVHVGTTVIALDYTAGDVSEPFEPTDDDQKVRNEFTAQRVDGGEATYSKLEGPNNVNDPADDPDGIGVYDEALQLNVADDNQLADLAAWRVHLGTVDEDRYPTVRIDLAKNPDLADEMTSLYLGDRLTVANPPPWMAPDIIDLIAEGGTETVGHPNDWDVVLNASPGTPWKVAQVATPQLLVQGSFETDLTGWTADNGSIARVASPGVPPFGGAWSVQITPNGTSGSGGVNGPLTAAGTVIPGEQYIASCWVYSPGGWSDIQACLDWYNAAGTFLSSGTGTGTAVPAGQWTLLSQTFTAPANASRLVPRGRHGGTPAAGNIWYADQITVREARATGYSAAPNLPNRADTSACQLVTAVTSTGTSFTVHTPPDEVFDQAPWIISTGLSTAPNLQPTQFPFDVRLGGEVVRVTACAPVLWDSFTRTTANGWGTASSGQTWVNTGGAAAEYSTNGSVGAHSLTSVNVSRYTTIGVAGADVELRADAATSVLATGGPHYVHLVARYLDANNMYAGRLAFNTNQTLQLVIQKRVGGTQTDLVTVNIPGVHAAAAFYTLRFQVEGTTLRAMAWPVGGHPPGRWQATVTDTSLTAAGSVGVRTVLSSANTNTLPVTASWDNFEVTTTQVMTVQRSINNVVKAQAAGAGLSLAQPAPLAL
jgi:hypothetical protein